MTGNLFRSGPITRAALDLVPRLWAFAGFGLALVAAGLVAEPGTPALAIGTTGLTFVAIAIVALSVHWRHRRARRLMEVTLASFVAEDASPTIATDFDGEIGFANAAARSSLAVKPGDLLSDALTDMFAQPAAELYRLQNRALAKGSARGDVPTPRGRMQLSVHRVGEEGFLWRLDALKETGLAARVGERIGLPMMTVSRSGAIIAMNEALRRLLGGRENALDKVFADLPLRPGEVHVLRGAHGTQPVLVAEVPRDGGKRELYLLPDPERPLVPQDAWGVVEALPVPLLKLDRSGSVAMGNARARQLLGVEDVLGRNLSGLVEGLGRPLGDWLAEAWAGRNLGRTETVKASLRSTETYLQVSLERLRDEDGDALIVVMNDATELKTLQNQFVQSQKMQAIGQLAGGIAHDFNNLLTAISGHCDLLLLRHDADDQDFADLTQIAQNANRAAALVGQLLAFSRKQTLRPDVIDLADTMADLGHLLGRLVGERITLDFTRPSDLRTVRADKRQLEQVVMNLVVNARDAMLPTGGTIKLAVENLTLDRALDRDQVRLAPGDYVTIRVIDEGHGIPADSLSKIFEPFYTTKGAGKGTGLGLSMAYGIVKQSGGFIFVDSVEGSGTTFTLYFPVYEPSPEDALAAKDAPQSVESAPNASGGVPKPTHDAGRFKGGHILLVEDEAPVRAFASRALRLRGYTVTEADNAEEALRYLSDPEAEVDVVVTDVVMPGMDGPTWVSKALEDRPGVKVVFMSGYAEESVSEHQKRIPNSVFLPKPFSLSELTATVSAQIH